ncbi:MAG TPA: ABC transporter ATP-binding protein [Blastocatellia bacterium]|nr:ABC transporter ATP-binding protein [Blastocatellia bacterium]
MKKDPIEMSWPVANLGDAMEALARRAGLLTNPVDMSNPPASFSGYSGEPLSRWIEAAGGRIGIEAEPIVCPYAEVEKLVRSAAPALIRLPGKEDNRFLAMLGCRRGSILVLAPDLRVRKVRADSVESLLTGEIEAPLLNQVNGLLDEMGVARRKQARARAAIFREQIGHIWVKDCWLLRLSPGARPREQARQSRLPGRLATILLAHMLQYALVILSWWVLGGAIFEGRLERGKLVAWGLLLLTAVPLRVLAVWSQGVFAINAASMLKKRLLCGALRLEPDEIKHEGAGGILGRVIESSALETLAMSGGFLGLVAVIELTVSAAILAAGAGGLLHMSLLVGWVALTGAVAWRYFGRRRQWTETRLGMTNDLIERMVGHRTRIAQERRVQWHEGEDQVLDRYLSQSYSMDRVAVVQSALARGWLVAGVAGLIPAFIWAGSSPAQIAISLGGIALASRAFIKLVASLSSLLGVAIAWQKVAPLFQAAGRRKKIAPPSTAILSRESPPDKGELLLEASDIVYRYGVGGEPVLRGCNLKIRAGDRLLLEGDSGGGKSTLASMISGLREPERGLILLGGLDHNTIGDEGWRRRVASSPQFHENHVLTGTFAFNLLMGKRWPPKEEDFREAEEVCRELGLGGLLDRMPSRLLQMVGETGWQLSHGERSRLFMARSLLQDADLVVLDESFAALDPETMGQCLGYVLGRARSLLVIAHV